MKQRSFMGRFKRQFSPHPTHVPRTAWQKLNRARTDSGWPLLTLNFFTSALFAALFMDWALSAHLLAALYWWLSFGSVIGLLRTGYVMLCVARGQAGQLAPEVPGTSQDGDRYQGGRTRLGRYQGKHT
ncbi:hypothetical protein ACWEBX_39030 [Streptomyces sp. NPDC005070]